MTPTIELRSCVPLFPVPDVAAAVRFYVERLGFEVAFEYDADAAGVRRGNIEIHFWRCADRHIAENTSCRISVVGIDVLYAEYEKAQVVHSNGRLELKPWGFREFAALDHAGNLLTFAQQAEAT